VPELENEYEMCDGSWHDWPEASFDDIRCHCTSLDNFAYCPIHGYGLGIGGFMPRMTPEQWIARDKEERSMRIFKRLCDD